MKGKIAVTPRSLSRDGHPALEKLSDAGYEVIFPTPGRMPEINELGAFLPGCVGYLAGIEPIPSKILMLCKKLKVISRNGVGVDNIDLAAAEKMGIAVYKAVGANARGVAELTISLLLAGLRHVPWTNSNLKAGEWQRLKGIEIQGRVLGLVGCGQIGKHVAEMAIGLGMQARAYDLYPDRAFIPSGDFHFVQLDELLHGSDVISLHCPPGEAPLINEGVIRKIKRGAYLINTARAGLIDPDSVLGALESGQLRGYATDVYQTEPPEMTELLRHKLVITTPHIGGFTEESIQRATEAAVDNLLLVLE